MAISPLQLAAVNSNSYWSATLFKIQYGSNFIRWTDHFVDTVIAGDGTYLADNEFRSADPVSQKTQANQATTRVIIGTNDPVIRSLFVNGTLLGAEVTVDRILIQAPSGAVIGAPIPRLVGTIWQYDIEDSYSADTAGIRPFNVTVDVRPETNDLTTNPYVSTNSASQKRYAATDNIFSLVEASANKTVVLTG